MVPSYLKNGLVKGHMRSQPLTSTTARQCRLLLRKSSVGVDVGGESPILRCSTRESCSRVLLSLTCKLCYFMLFTGLSSNSPILTAQQPIHSSGVQRDSNTKVSQTVKIELLLRALAECPSNLLLLSDLVSAKGSDVLVQQIIDVPLAPAPRMGNSQVWTRSDIEKSLSLRGIPSDVIRWGGAVECSVRRIEGTRIEKNSVKNSGEFNAKETPLDVQFAGYQATLAKNETQAMKDASTSKAILDKSQFTTPFTTPATITQAERTVASVIENYLQTKTASAGG